MVRCAADPSVFFLFYFSFFETLRQPTSRIKVSGEPERGGLVVGLAKKRNGGDQGKKDKTQRAASCAVRGCMTRILGCREESRAADSGGDNVAHQAGPGWAGLAEGRTSEAMVGGACGAGG